MNSTFLTFSVIENKVDSRFVMYINDQSGYCNISKCASSETIDYWLDRIGRNKIKACENLNVIKRGEGWFSITTGDPDHMGVYVHRHLYDHFLMWICPFYAMHLSVAMSSYDVANVAPGSKKIMALEAKIREQAAMIENLREREKKVQDNLKGTEMALKMFEDHMAEINFDAVTILGTIDIDKKFVMKEEIGALDIMDLL